MCSFRDHFLDPFFGSFWSLKTKILILYCFLHHFCAVSDHPRRPPYNQVVDSVGHFGGPFFWILFLDPFDHWRRKSWFCIVFYSTFAPWAIFENVFFFCHLDHFGVQFGAQNWPQNQQNMCSFQDHFLDPYFGSFLITQNEHLDSVLFFTVLLRRERPPTKADL